MTARTMLLVAAGWLASYAVPPQQAGMRRVAGGTFMMGLDSVAAERIRVATGMATLRTLLPAMPAHRVTIGAFSVDTVEVSNADFARFVAANPGWRKDALPRDRHNGRYLDHWHDGSPGSRLDHPVTFVTWQAAQAFCAWQGKRLPTEAEFEWAMQDGVTRSDYPWGNAPPHDSLVNWSGDGIGGTVPVASYPPNARGLYDLAGSVWEFTADPWRGSWAQVLSGDTLAVEPEPRRVIRGGSWGGGAINLVIQYRDSHREGDAQPAVGFRCARSLN